MSQPRLLLLDEPSLGLAPIIIQQIFDTHRAAARARDDDLPG
ncbi:branched chain amino acid ABC transporter ATPase [Klebsiella pneumoniae]|uniref:Branched chain amino acid ABC transporter ATPase n=1 Tax=Klebsiella pneumoniae TaxID=573 RepID=A0A377XGM0_KLEPN|nr:branched chain amino acid ABC transporter ATPase [Klebsiella pneumoniae]